jgi:DnaJ-class molecular chaperone
MHVFNDIDEARILLGLGKTATLRDIKKAYSKLAHIHHPDKQYNPSQQDMDKMKKINWAYKVLMDYCNSFKYSFNKEDVARTYPHEEYLRKWSENWFDSI